MCLEPSVLMRKLLKPKWCLWQIRKARIFFMILFVLIVIMVRMQTDGVSKTMVLPICILIKEAHIWRTGIVRRLQLLQMALVPESTLFPLLHQMLWLTRRHTRLRCWQSCLLCKMLRIYGVMVQAHTLRWMLSLQKNQRQLWKTHINWRLPLPLHQPHSLKVSKIRLWRWKVKPQTVERTVVKAEWWIFLQLQSPVLWMEVIQRLMKSSHLYLPLTCMFHFIAVKVLNMQN